MSTSILISRDEYLKTSYQPDCEWVDGEVKERNVGTGSHATVQTFFIKFFGGREAQWGIRVAGELRIQVARNRFRVPDVLLMRSEDAFEEIVTIPPLLCIEVLSPDDRMDDLQEKVDDFIAMGVGAIWVVNPRLRKTMMVQAGGWMPVEELTVPGTAIRMSHAEVFAELNALEGRRSAS